MPNYDCKCDICGEGTGKVCKCGEAALPVDGLVMSIVDVDAWVYEGSIGAEIREDLLADDLYTAAYNTGCRLAGKDPGIRTLSSRAQPGCMSRRESEHPASRF